MAEGERRQARAAYFKYMQSILTLVPRSLLFHCDVSKHFWAACVSLMFSSFVLQHSRPLLSPLFLFRSSWISNVIPGVIVGKKAPPRRAFCSGLGFRAD